MPQRFQPGMGRDITASVPAIAASLPAQFQLASGNRSGTIQNPRVSSA